MIEGFPDISDYRTNGIFGASATSTANPDENRVGAAFPFTTGVGYASLNLYVWLPFTQVRLALAVGFRPRDSERIRSDQWPRRHRTRPPTS